LFIFNKDGKIVNLIWFSKQIETFLIDNRVSFKNNKQKAFLEQQAKNINKSYICNSLEFSIEKTT